MNKRLLTLSIVLLALISCQNQIEGDTSKPLQNNAAQTTVKDTLENFNIFFDRFNQDSVFQIERVKYPLKFEYRDFVGVGSEIETQLINRKDWKFVSYAWDSSYETRDIDAYTQKFKIKGDTARVLMEGTNNGIYITLVFARMDKKWYFLEYLDYSM